MRAAGCGSLFATMARRPEARRLPGSLKKTSDGKDKPNPNKHHHEPHEGTNNDCMESDGPCDDGMGSSSSSSSSSSSNSAKQHSTNVFTTHPRRDVRYN
jgi:hypothetical protein